MQNLSHIHTIKYERPQRNAQNFCLRSFLFIWLSNKVNNCQMLALIDRKCEKSEGYLRNKHKGGSRCREMEDKGR